MKYLIGFSMVITCCFLGSISCQEPKTQKDASVGDLISADSALSLDGSGDALPIDAVAIDILGEDASTLPKAVFVDFDLGQYHTCGIKNDGALLCWGYQEHGILSFPSGQFGAVSAGAWHNCAIKLDGTVECWGAGTIQEGICVDPQTLECMQSIPPEGVIFGSLSAGHFHTCGITDGNREIICWKSDLDDRTRPPPGYYKEVAAGRYHSCALSLDGTIVCFGMNGVGQLDSPAGVFEHLCAGADYNCAISEAGTIHCWGEQTYSAIGAPAGQYSQLTCGRYHACALALDETVKCWGWGQTDDDCAEFFCGQAMPPPGVFKKVRAGGLHTCGLRSDNTIECWGANSFAQSSAP